MYRTQTIVTLGLALAWLAASATFCPAGGKAGVTGAVPRDGFDLHYRVVGAKGPYVVLLAGGPGIDVDYMAGVASELAKSYRCVMLEQRGTGRSKLKSIDETTITWPGYLGDLEALRKHLKEDKLVLLGHSWGMAYGLAYASEYPDHCRAVVTLGSCPINEEYSQLFDDNRASRLHPSEKETVAVWFDSERSKTDNDRGMYEYLRAITPSDFFDRKKGIAQALRWELAWCHAKVGEAADKSLWKDYDLRPKLKKVTCPVLFVHGHQDGVGEANMFEAKSHLRNAQLRFVHRCGHYPWLDQPEETWKIVLPFLAKGTK